LGVTLKTEAGHTSIQSIDFDSPAQQAGVAVGDELLAIDGFRVSAEQLSDRLRGYHPGDELTLTYFHQDQLCTGVVCLAPALPSSYHIQPLPDATVAQRQLLAGWLGATSEALFE
jgi:predicted metalloprotease with PDZ domain